jgi:hypothetical protein
MLENKSESHVGYCKPPKSHQFKKGVSGNPKGRPKTRKVGDLNLVLRNILKEPLTISEEGERKTISKYEGVLAALRVKALKGDARSIKRLMKLSHEVGSFAKQEQKFVEIAEPTGEMGAIVKQYKALKSHG